MVKRDVKTCDTAMLLGTSEVSQKHNFVQGFYTSTASCMILHRSSYSPIIILMASSSRTPLCIATNSQSIEAVRPCGHYQGRLLSGAFLPFFFQVGSCSPRAQLAMPPNSLPGRLGRLSSVSKISVRSCDHRMGCHNRAQRS